MQHKRLAQINLFAALVLLISLAGTLTLAQGPEPAWRTVNTTPASAGKVHWLVLPLPRVDPAKLPPGLSLEQTRTYARNLIQRQAQPFLEELRPLKQRGVIADFEIDVEQNAIQVREASSAAQDELRKLPGSLRTSEQEPLCQTNVAREVEKQVLGFSLGRYALLASPQAPDTDPSIHANVQPGSELTYIMGKTTGSTSVSMTISRGSQLIATQSTQSDANGDYWFYPEWTGDCTRMSNSWTLQAGDLVWVNSHGSTVYTVIAHLNGWMDATNDTVGGGTDIGRLVEVNLYDYTSTLCSPNHYVQSAPADGSGHYLVDFTSQVDFKGSAQSQVDARDGNGNSTFAIFDASNLAINVDLNEFSGYLPPQVSYTATLTRGGTVIDTYDGNSSLYGNYGGSFSYQFEPNDVITVETESALLTFTVASFSVTFDASTDTATGRATPNARLKADFLKNTNPWHPTSCSWDSACTSTNADGNGYFTLTAQPLDLVRGDSAYFYLYDSQGNYQYVFRSFTAIYAELSNRTAAGYWYKPYDNLAVNLRDSTNALLERQVDQAWSDGSFIVYFWDNQILPSDHIEVGNGVITETMTVQNVTAILDSSTRQLTGNAPNTPMLVDLQDYNPSLGVLEGECRSLTVTGGTYNQSYAARNFGATQANVFSQGYDGYYTQRYAHAFNVSIHSGDSYLRGWTKTPYEAVTLTVQEGINVYTDTMTSYADGSFGFDIYPPNFFPLYPGARVLIDSSQDADLIVPTITFNADAVNNRVYGQAPANQPLELRLESSYTCLKGLSCLNYSPNILAFSDATGNYSFSLAGFTICDEYFCQCKPASARCTMPSAEYYSPEEYHYYYTGPYPPDVPADTYEVGDADNTSDTATPYAGLSSHTFHIDSDVDWITFNVNPEMVGTPLHLQTLNLGATSDTVLELYASDGRTLLGTNDDYGQSYRSLLAWTPPAVGTYYVKLRPYGTYANTFNCGASYDFFIFVFIASHWIYLP